MLREFVVGLLVVAILFTSINAFMLPIYDQQNIVTDTEIQKSYDTMNKTFTFIVANVTGEERKIQEEGDFIDVITGGFKLGKTTYALLKLPFRFIFNVRDILREAFRIIIGESYANLSNFAADVSYALLIAFLIFGFLRAILGRTP